MVMGRVVAAQPLSGGRTGDGREPGVARRRQRRERSGELTSRERRERALLAMCIALPEEGKDYLARLERRAPLAQRRARRRLAARAPRGPGLQSAPRRCRAGRPDRRAGHPRPRRARLGRARWSSTSSCSSSAASRPRSPPPARQTTTSAAPPSVASAPPWSSASPAPSALGGDERPKRSVCGSCEDSSVEQGLARRMPGERNVAGSDRRTGREAPFDGQLLAEEARVGGCRASPPCPKGEIDADRLRENGRGRRHHQSDGR